MKELPKELTVLIDTREKFPILFPAVIKVCGLKNKYDVHIIRIKSKKAKLDYGDYALEEYPECCVVERKASQSELLTNLFNKKDSIRQGKSLMKLSKCKYPYLLVEAPLSEMLSTPKRGAMKEPELLLNKLYSTVAKYGLHLLWMPWRRSKAGRRLLGVNIVHLMVAHAFEDLYNVKIKLV